MRQACSTPLSFLSTNALHEVMYQSVCKFGVGGEVEEKMAFTFGRGKKISAWLRDRPRSFFDWEKKEVRKEVKSAVDF